MLTNIRLHNLKNTQCQRTIEVNKLKALTKNIKDKKQVQFLVHVGGEGEYDYEYFSDDLDQIFKHIHAVYQ